MAYASTSDVQALLPEFTIGSSSQPSISEVTDLITEAEAIVNGVLSAQGYETVPATGTNDTAMLKGIVAKRVAAQVWLAAFPANDAPDKVKMWFKDFDNFVSRLRRGEQHLVDQQPQGDQEAVFGVIRTPTRDEFFTNRWDTTDWDE